MRVRMDRLPRGFRLYIDYDPARKVYQAIAYNAIGRPVDGSFVESNHGLDCADMCVQKTWEALLDSMTGIPSREVLCALEKGFSGEPLDSETHPGIMTL